jgi:hypothetical protein
MMLEESAEAQRQVLDQAAGAEALVIGRDDLHDPDLTGLEQLLHGGRELAHVLTKQSARHADADHSLRHVWQCFDHRILLPRKAGALSR